MIPIYPFTAVAAKELVEGKPVRGILYCIIAFVLVCTVLPASAQAGGPVLKVAVDGPYPPFTEEDENGNMYGFDVDIAHALCKELGRTCAVRKVPFDEIIPSLVEGKIDIAIAGMGPSEERKKLVDFTERYFRSLSIFIERSRSLPGISPDTLKGLKVGAQANTLQAEYLRTTYGEGITLVMAESHIELFHMLQDKKVDLILVDGLPGYAMLKTDLGDGLETVGEPVESGGAMDWASIAVSKKQPELLKAINEAIQTLRRNGEYGRINRKYFDFNIY